MLKNNPNNGGIIKEFCLEYYKAARQEILFQLNIRERVLIFLLGSIGVVLGITFRDIDSPQYHFLLIIPWISLGSCYLYLEHHYIVGGLVNYLQNDWWYNLPEKFKSFPQWDKSFTREILYKSSSNNLLKIQFKFFVFPSLLSLGIVALLETSFCLDNLLFYIWIVTIIPFICTLILTIRSYYKRTKIEQVKAKNYT